MGLITLHFCFIPANYFLVSGSQGKQSSKGAERFPRPLQTLSCLPLCLPTGIAHSWWTWHFTSLSVALSLVLGLPAEANLRHDICRRWNLPVLLFSSFCNTHLSSTGMFFGDSFSPWTLISAAQQLAQVLYLLVYRFFRHPPSSPCFLPTFSVFCHLQLYLYFSSRLSISAPTFQNILGFPW